VNREAHIFVFFALQEEAAPFRQSCADKPGISVYITGIGRANTERSLRSALASSMPQLVLSCGFAGGLNPALKTGTVVFATDDDAALTSALFAAGARPVRFHNGRRVAATATEKKTLWEATGADAVDMESEIVRAICREHRIPSATIRVISDAADEDLPLDFNAFMTAEYQVHYRKLALALVCSPKKIPRLLRLRRQTRMAATNLANVLRATLISS